MNTGGLCSSFSNCAVRTRNKDAASQYGLVGGVDVERASVGSCPRRTSRYGRDPGRAHGGPVRDRGDRLTGASVARGAAERLGLRPPTARTGAAADPNVDGCTSRCRTTSTPSGRSPPCGPGSTSCVRSRCDDRGRRPAMVDVANESDRHLMEAFMYRHHPSGWPRSAWWRTADRTLTAVQSCLVLQ